MFKKYAFLYFSLLCINIYSMDDSVILNQTHIPHDIIPYIEVIADMYEDLGSEFNQDIKYEGEFKNQIDKPIFQKIIELLSQSISIINNKPVDQITNSDWGNVLEYIESQKFSLDELVSMLEVINFLRIPLLEKPLLIHVIHVMVDMLKANQHKTVMKALSIIPADYQNELKHLLYDYYPFDVWLAWEYKFKGLNICQDVDDGYRFLCTDDRKHIVSYRYDTIKIMAKNKKLLHKIKLSGLSHIRNIVINNNYIVVVTSNSEIMIWHIISGLMIKEFLRDSEEINIVYIDELSFGFDDNIRIVFYNFYDLEESIADGFSREYFAFMSVNNTRFLGYGYYSSVISCTRKSKIPKIPLVFKHIPDQNEKYIYDKFKQSLPKINARGFLSKHMQPPMLWIKNELCNQFDCMGSDEVHMHFKDQNNNDIVISKLPGNNTYICSALTTSISLDEGLGINYNQIDEQRIIYYIHENNLIDILNTVYPYDNSYCFVM